MKRTPLPQGLGMPSDVPNQIELFNYDYGNGNGNRDHSLRTDYVPYVALVATYLGVRMSLYALAAHSAEMVTEITTVELEVYTKIAA